MTAGTLLVFQGGGPTAVVNATLAGVLEGSREAGVARVLGARRGVAGLLEGDLLDLTEWSPERIQALARAPGAALATSRHRLDQRAARRALDLLRSHHVTAVVAIGGNDTAVSARRLLEAAAELGSALCVVHAPKTIDNDLPANDHTPGYPSAARFLALATRGLLLDSWSVRELYSVTFLEVQGRNAGWLAASCGLATPAELAPHLHLLFPERPPSSRDTLVDDLVAHSRQLGWIVVVVPETLRDRNRTPLAGDDPRWIDPHGHRYHRSPAETLAQLVEARSGRRTRVIRPGAIARSFPLTTVALDREEARAVGRTAALWAARGMNGVSVAIQRVSDEPYRMRLQPVPLDALAGQERLLPDPFIGPDERSITAAFRQYMLPLVGDLSSDHHSSWSR